jgi:hypothetical protein
MSTVTNALARAVAAKAGQQQPANGQ